MPLYEYECEENGHRFELIRKFSDPPLRTCIKCKSRVTKLISAPAIAFKGSGWYVTDYARGGSGAPGSGRSKEKVSSEAKSSSDSKSASESKGSSDSKSSSDSKPSSEIKSKGGKSKEK